MKKIVLFLQNRNFLGAQIVHIPLLNALKEAYPNSTITIFSKHKISGILKELQLVDKIIFEREKIEIIKDYINEKADITILLRSKSLFLNLLVGISNRNIKIGFENSVSKLFFTKTKKTNPKIYRANNYLALIDKKSDNLQNSINNTIIIIPGAGGDEKIWDINNYIKLSQLLKESHASQEIIFILGKKEESYMDILKENHQNYLFELNIKDLSHIIYEAKLVIANDCGPSHFAQIHNQNFLILYTNDDGNAETIIKEWFNKKENSYPIKSAKFTTINSIKSTEVFQFIENRHLLK